LIVTQALPQVMRMLLSVFGCNAKARVGASTNAPARARVQEAEGIDAI
jgi:hypothetical protein